MDSSVNDILSIKRSLPQCNGGEETKKSKKKNIITTREGNYLVIYSVDENGKRTLIEKIPITQSDDLKKSSNYNDRTKEYADDLEKNAKAALTAFKCSVSNNSCNSAQDLVNILLKQSQNYIL